jgi:hypothetical protein
MIATKKEVIRDSKYSLELLVASTAKVRGANLMAIIPTGSGAPVRAL